MIRSIWSGNLAKQTLSIRINVRIYKTYVKLKTTYVTYALDTRVLRQYHLPRTAEMKVLTSVRVNTLTYI